MSAITNIAKFIGSSILWIPFAFLGWLCRRSLLWWMTFIVIMLAFVFPVLDHLSRNL